MRQLAGDVRGRIGACMVLVFACIVFAMSSESLATSVDPTGRIAVGSEFTCAIKSDDTVWCWGRNDQGQLGSSAHMVLSESLTPVQTSALGGGRVPIKIVAGTEHACVLATDGSVWCWGNNGQGQLAGSIGNKTDPTQVSLGGTATLIAAGGANTCAVLTDNSLKCWGQNNVGQLGIGSADGTAHYTPTSVSSIPSSFSVASIDIGSGSICASSAANEVWCWGKNNYGQLGTGATAASVSTPGRTLSLGGLASSIAAGTDHSCAVVGAGLMCFGRNNYGQIGQALATTSDATPRAVTISGSVATVTAGDTHTCIKLSTGAVQCFGRNNNSQLGRTGAGASDSVAAAVQGLPSGAVDVVAGGSHTCAMTPTGDVKCWGNNSFGQLGDNTQNNSDTAIAVLYMNALPTTTAPSTTAATTTLPTTTAPSTTAPSSSSSSSSSTTSSSSSTSVAPSVVTTIANTVAPSTTQPVALSTSNASTVKSLRIRKNRRTTAAKIAAAVSLKIPKRSQGSMRISITRGTKYCKFVGSTVRGIRAGSCTVTVVLIPKKGKPTVRTLKITVV